MKDRRGVAAVEFAIILPVIILLFLGMVELGRGIQMQQVITNAAREGAHAAAKGADATTTVTDCLSKAGLPAGQVLVTQQGEAVRVDVSVPFVSLCKIRYVESLSATSTFRRN